MASRSARSRAARRPSTRSGRRGRSTELVHVACHRNGPYPLDQFGRRLLSVERIDLRTTAESVADHPARGGPSAPTQRARWSCPTSGTRRSARTFAAAGFPALATSSGALANALGYEDHEQAPVDEVLAAIARITRSVDIPVTADFEAGYGLPPAEIVECLLEAGAAGCNLEDTDHAVGALRPVAEQAEWLGTVVELAAGRLVVNARVDTYLGEPGGRRRHRPGHRLPRRRCRLHLPDRFPRRGHDGPAGRGHPRSRQRPLVPQRPGSGPPGRVGSGPHHVRLLPVQDRDGLPD